jgi:REP element-mobilizing transposase RayT
MKISQKIEPHTKKYPPHPTAYGGRLRNTRAGRRGPRTLSTQRSIHLVLRTSRIIKAWSFTRSQNRHRVRSIIIKHAQRNNISIIGYANVGNHLHLHLKIASRGAYMRSCSQ